MVTTTSARAVDSAASGFSQEPTTKTEKARLRGWPKKRHKQQPLNVHDVPSEIEVLPECELQEAEMTVETETTWAILWLRRLRPRRKSRLTSVGKGKGEQEQPRLMTLAEQLREAQESPLLVPQSKVTPANIYTDN